MTNLIKPELILTHAIEHFNFEDDISAEHAKLIYKQLIYKIELYKQIYFKIIKKSVQKIQNTKYKMMSECKLIITEYNSLVDSYNNRCFGFKNTKITVSDIRTLSDFKFIEKLENIPFKSAYKILSYENIIDVKSEFPINGLICFLSYKRLKTKTDVKIFAFVNSYMNNNKLACIDLYPIIKAKNPNLINEITIIVSGLAKDWDNVEEILDIKINNKTKTKYNKHDACLGYLCCLSVSKDNTKKEHIIDVLYYYNEIKNINLHLHIYFKMFQTCQISTKVYKNILALEDDRLKHLIEIYNLKNLSIVSPCDNAPDKNGLKIKTKEPVLILWDNEFYVNLKQFVRAIKPKKIEYDNVKVDKSKNISTVLQFTNSEQNQFLKFRISLSLKSLLYSNFANNKKGYNHDILYITQHDKQVYIPDVLQNPNTLSDNDYYQNVSKKYIIQNNNIIIEKNINPGLEYLLGIDSNLIDWADFILFSDEYNFDQEDVYTWFVNTYSKYKKVKPEIAQHITDTFKYLSLSQLLKFVLDENKINTFIKNYSVSDYVLQDYDLKILEDNNNEIEDNTLIINIIRMKLFIFKLDEDNK